MSKMLSLVGALATVVSATSANAAWLVSGDLVEERVAACTQTTSTSCTILFSNFPASIQNKLVEFIDISCTITPSSAVPLARLSIVNATRFQDLAPPALSSTGGQAITYNSLTSFRVQATTNKQMQLTFSSGFAVAIAANCLLTGQLLD